MARVTYFVVLAFEAVEGGEIVAGEALEMRDGGAAVRAAARIAGRKAGAIAFSRSGDPQLGDYDDAVVLARHGKLPDDVAGYLS